MNTFYNTNQTGIVYFVTFSETLKGHSIALKKLKSCFKQCTF